MSQIPPNPNNDPSGRQDSPAGSPANSQLESGTYEIIQSRLRSHSQLLNQRLQALNQDRREVFGSIPTQLLSTQRITTAHNCIAQDIVPIGDQFIFGYNVMMGLKSVTELEDVFSIYHFGEDGLFHETSLELLSDRSFLHDFFQLYKYYKETRFLKFHLIAPHVYLVFQVGRTSSDFKAFKFLISGNELKYLGNRSDHEVVFPDQHDFSWIRTHRDLHRGGRHPHISIEDRVFVETVGGDLTIKVEDNTEDGVGIYSEPVNDNDQSLDDAEIFYAIVGNLILLKIRPFREPNFRYLIFNEKNQSVRRMDSIANACVSLPEDHGLIFSNGYYLQTGVFKTFENDSSNLMYERRIPAANGEDFLYVFYSRNTGQNVLMSYNMIQQSIENPILCNGFSIFESGKMLFFRSDPTPQKHHSVQIWQTPFVGQSVDIAEKKDSYLYKIGNRDIVRAMAECHEIINLIQQDDSYRDLYLDLVKKSTDILDSYFWLAEPGAQNLAEPLRDILGAASAAVDEFEKVVQVRRNTRQLFESTSQQANSALSQAVSKPFRKIDDFVEALASLRKVRGQVISLKELKYVDLTAVDELDGKIADKTEELSRRCVQFLVEPESLAPYAERLLQQEREIETVSTVMEARQLGEAISQGAVELEMLIEIVSNLKIEDGNQRTQIIDAISTIYSNLNQTRARLRRTQQALQTTEGEAEFHSQLKLISQAVINYLDLCDTPQRCDEYLTRMMVQVEELEGKFAEFDDFILQLAEKRDEIYAAFDNRKLQLIDSRNRRATAIMGAADRILNGIRSRVANFKSLDEINSYFVSDLMIDKVRDLVRQLGELNETVKVDDIQSRLKTIREDTVRQLRDKQELFVDGQNIIQFGRFKFSVNTQPLDLTTVMKDGQMFFHLSGTNFFERVTNPELLATREVWNQSLISENDGVYRAEYLAYLIFQTGPEEGQQVSNTGLAPDWREQISGNQEQALELVQRFMAPRYTDGYIKGVHDHDATKILHELLKMDQKLGLLRYSSADRGLAVIFWLHLQQQQPEQRQLWEKKLSSLAAARELFSQIADDRKYVRQLAEGIEEFLAETGLELPGNPAASARYLFDQLLQQDKWVCSGTAHRLRTSFLNQVQRRQGSDRFQETLVDPQLTVTQRYSIVRDWVATYLQQLTAEDHRSVSTASSFAAPSLSPPLSLDSAGSEPDEFSDAPPPAKSQRRGKHKSLTTKKSDAASPSPALKSGEQLPNGPEQTELDVFPYLDEVTGLLLDQELGDRRVIEVASVATLKDLLGDHPRIRDQDYRLDYHEFQQRLGLFCDLTVPAYESFVHLKKQVTDRRRSELRLHEFRPRVLSSFVRNRLINDTYLPLIGANLAKQIGVIGEDKRTDLMGMLLLISPPGYGKTTLMEYVANRLGITFVTISGPALGNRVTSLDPAEAPNAGAREEVEKLNLALEMGDNVMIYVDDIQHCNPEFLQKFIPLCDATRKIEGVFRGQTRTYDLRGRKVAVVMAGNPYTESGEKFKIPDMLASRADTYNLGDVIGDNQQSFELSYLENALTSNPTLARLNSRSTQDVFTIVSIAERPEAETPILEGTYSIEEINEFVSVMRKLMRAREIILAVNRQYIDSAAQADAYRTEPAFKLQGSYRDMNKIAEKVVPIMNDQEMRTLIRSHYQNQAQTLTSDAQANLLKLDEIMGLLEGERLERWNDIKRTFQRNLLLGSADEGSQLGQVIAQMTSFSEGLHQIQRAVRQGVHQLTSQREENDPQVLQSATLQQVSQAVLELAKFNQTLETLADRLTEVSGSPSSESGTRDPHTIQVVNRIPPVFLDVIRNQFSVLQTWVEPIIELAATHPNAKNLVKSVKLTKRNYQKLIDRIASEENPEDPPVSEPES
jgi:hypothetical protein